MKSVEQFRRKRMGVRGFTLLELIVVVSVIALVGSILTPALFRAKRKAREVIKTNNFKQITIAANLFAAENNDWYPGSTATLGFAGRWNWHDPRKITAAYTDSFEWHRSMSEYLGSFIDDPEILVCPNGPGQKRGFKRNLDESWEKGDWYVWGKPGKDMVIGTSCFYWNYVGRVSQTGDYFVGPRQATGRWGESKLLVSDYLGNDNWQSPDAYASCDKFKGSGKKIPSSDSTAAFWAGDSLPEIELWAGDSLPEIELCAGYSDGHVEKYSSLDTVGLKVIIDRETGETYTTSDEAERQGPGMFFIPEKALR